MSTLAQDIRFAFRTLRRRPTFAAIAIATIALAIGSTTAIYSVVDGVLFRPPAYGEPDRLVAVWQTFPHWKKEPILASSWDQITLNPIEFRELKAATTSFTDIGIWGAGAAMLAGDTPEQVAVVRASASLLPTLGVSPTVGRGFLPGEDVSGGPHVTMLSYDTWQSRYSGDPAAIGRTVSFGDNPYTIVGVLPRGLTLNRSAVPAAFWIPMGQERNDLDRTNHSHRAIARLAPGVTLERALTETERILRGTESPEKRGTRLTPWQRDETRLVRGPLLLLLGAVGLLLLVACVNVATLMVGEAATRDREMAARIALGASPMRIIRQLLTESLVLAAAGSTLGIVLAWWMTKALVALAPPRLAGVQSVHVDLPILAFALVVASVTGILFGLAPALMASRSNPQAVMRSSAGQSAGGRGRLQRTLIAVELALSVVLLVGAGLLSRSLENLTRVDPGFRTERLLTVRVAAPRTAYGDMTALRALYGDAMARIASLPGIQGVTASSLLPFTNANSGSGIVIEGREAEGRRETQQRTIAANYFDVLGVPLRAGRMFTEADRGDAPFVVIISEALARRDWPNESAIGKRVKYQGEWRTVVGIVADTKYRQLSMADQATIYAPLPQSDFEANILVRTKADPVASIPVIRAAIREVAPRVAITTVDVMTDQIRRSYADERYRTMLISLFGVIAAVLAAVGMFGVTARAVSGRMREAGIRVALGATQGSVIRLIVGHTLAGVTVGVIVGVAGALAISRVLSPYLFGVTTHDPATYAGVLAFLALTSVGASWIPARRAGRVEPAIVLRSE